MRILVVTGALCLALFAVAGCSEEGEGGFSSGSSAFDRELEEQERELEELEEEEFNEEFEPEPEEFESEPEPEEECDPSYVGACLDPNVSDYDCEGGSGDGPNYTGPVEVVGDDHYGLDADGDGYACE